MSDLPESLKDPQKVLERGEKLNQLIEQGAFLLACQVLELRNRVQAATDAHTMAIGDLARCGKTIESYKPVVSAALALVCEWEKVGHHEYLEMVCESAEPEDADPYEHAELFLIEQVTRFLREREAAINPAKIPAQEPK